MNRLVLAAAAAASLAFFPRAALADDELPGYSPPHQMEYQGGNIPSYAHLEDRPNGSLIGGGLGLAGAAYGLSLLYALSTCGAQMDCRSGSQWLYLPIVGPFFTATKAPTTGGQALSVFDGAAQAAGVGMAVAGLFLPRKVVVWQDKGAALSVVPAAVGGGTGVSVTLTTM